jgi:hypothetical protein
MGVLKTTGLEEDPVYRFRDKVVTLAGLMLLNRRSGEAAGSLARAARTFPHSHDEPAGRRIKRRAAAMRHD